MWKAHLPEPYTLERIGFQPTSIIPPSKDINFNKLKNYEQERDFPALDSTSHLSVHLRFGTVSIRELVSKSLSLKARASQTLL